MGYFEKSMAVRKAIVESSTLDRLRAVLKAHHEGKGSDARIDTRMDRPGSNRAVYAIGKIDVDGATLHIATKAVIPETLLEDMYTRDNELTAREIGAFEHLAEKGEKTPAFVLALTYLLDGQNRFGLLIEDLTSSNSLTTRSNLACNAAIIVSS